MATDAIIVGGGIVGCSVALNLAKAGLKVVIVERRRIGSEASRAAAGMLSPQTGAVGPSRYFDLALRSRSMYRNYAAELAELSGIDPQYRDEGLICVALDEGEAAEIDQWSSWQSGAGLRTERLSADELMRIEPAVTRSAVGAALVPGDHQIENRRIMDAIDMALRRLGVTVIQGEEVTGLLTEGTRVNGVTSARGEHLNAGVVVVAAGAWSTGLLAPVGVKVETIPARGQMLAVRSDRPLFNCVIHAGSCYLVPRRDNRIVIGSTVEYTGFKKGVTVGGIAALLDWAKRLAPSIDGLEIVETWSGLRPDTPDHMPVMGPAGPDSLYLATGHFRNGILLAPVTASLIADAIVDKRIAPEIEFFGLKRFERD